MRRRTFTAVVVVGALLAGIAAVLLTDPGHDPTGTVADTARLESTPVGGNVTRTPPPAIRQRALEVEPGRGLIEGHVQSLSGVPIVHAEVLLFVARSASLVSRPPAREEEESGVRTGLERTLTDEEGHFRLKRLDSDDVALLVVHPDYLSELVECVILDRPLVIPLRPALKLSGRVIDPSGQGVSGARIHAEPAHESLLPIWERLHGIEQQIARGEHVSATLRSVTGNDGAFSIASLYPFDYSLHIIAPVGHVAGAVDSVRPGTEGLEIEIDLSRRLLGRVVDEREAPIPGVAVRLVPVTAGEEAEARLERKLAELMGAIEPTSATDLDGTFSFGGIASGDYTLVIDARGHLSQKVRVSIGREYDKTDIGAIVLAPAAVVAGRVLSESGDPIAAAAVWLLEPRDAIEIVEKPRRRRPVGAKHSTQTDESGRFAITTVPAGTYFLEAAMTGYAPGGLTEIDAPADDVVVVLDEGVPVRGRIVDDETGAPLAGVTVTIDDGVEVHSDVDGAFSIPGVAPRDFDGQQLYIDLLAMDREHAPGRLPNQINFRDGRPQPLEVRLRPWSFLFGRVVNESGDAVALARLQVFGSAGRALADRSFNGTPIVHSDGSGEFVIAWEGRGRELVVSHPDYARLHAGSLSALARSEEATLVLRQGARISGRVLDARGEPESSAAIILVRAERGAATQFIGKDIVAAGMRAKRPESHMTVTDLEGRYEIARLEPGAYHLAARKSGCGTVQYAVALGDGETEFDVELGAAVSFQGIVSGPDGVIDGADVVATMELGGTLGQIRGSVLASFVTGSDGTYELEELPARSLTVAARAHGYETRVVRGVVPIEGGARLPLRLEKLPALVVRVHDSASGLPIDDFDADLEVLETVTERDNSDCYAELKTAFDNTSGSVRTVDGLCPGATYEIRVRSPYHAPVAYRIAMSSGERREFDLGLESGGTVVNRIIDDATEEPVAGARVALTDSRKTKPRFEGVEVLTDENGIARLAHLPRGEYDIVVSHSNYISARRAAIAVDGASLEIEWRVRPGATLAGRLRNGSGKDFGPGIIVSVTLVEPTEAIPPGNRRARSARVAQDGRFEVDSLVPGWYEVTLSVLERMPRKGEFWTPDGHIHVGRTYVEHGVSRDVEFSVP